MFIENCVAVPDVDPEYRTIVHSQVSKLAWSKQLSILKMRKLEVELQSMYIRTYGTADNRFLRLQTIIIILIIFYAGSKHIDSFLIFKTGIFSVCAPPPSTLCSPQLQSTCHYIVNHHVKIWHVLLGGANNMHPLSWGGTNGKDPKTETKLDTKKSYGLSSSWPN